MRRLSGVCALLILCTLPRGLAAQAAASVQEAIAPGDSARPETIERFLVVADMERLHNESMEASLAAQLKMNPRLATYEPLFRRFMGKYAGYAVMKPDVVRIYRANFSEADMQEMIRFYQSPFGRRLMAKMPLIMAQSMELGAQRVQAHLPELVADVQAQAGAETGAAAPLPAH